jgi:hypothetical protein
MKNLVIKTAKTIWHWLTVQRYIEFGTVEDENLQEDFNRAKEQWQIANFVKIMKKLVKFERDLELTKSGLLLTDDEATKRALETFRRAKQHGVLDELNALVEKEITHR